LTLLIPDRGSKGGDQNVSTTIILLLAAWLSLNVAFVAMRFYVTADHGSHAEPDIAGYPTLLNH
jgi:hypothetical protein